MTWKAPFPPAAVEYVKLNAREWPSVTAYKVEALFGYKCTARGVRGLLKRLNGGDDDGSMQA